MEMQVAIGLLKEIADQQDESVVLDADDARRMAEMLERLDQEHRRLTDEARGLRLEREEIIESVRKYRQVWDIHDEEISNLADDVAALLTGLAAKGSNAQDEATALRGTLEKIRDTARKEENDAGDLTDVHRQIYIRNLLGAIAHQSSEGLKTHRLGAELRKDLRQLEALVGRFEDAMRENGGWSYSSDRTLAERIQRVVNHYTRMAAEAADNAQTFKLDMLIWLRGMSINAESVSWGSTHHEKDARLRGLIEVIEAACKRVNEMRVSDLKWGGGIHDWLKPDFPVRELKRRIYDLEAEIKRLKPQTVDDPPDINDIPL